MVYNLVIFPRGAPRGERRAHIFMLTYIRSVLMVCIVLHHPNKRYMMYQPSKGMHDLGGTCRFFVSVSVSVSVSMPVRNLVCDAMHAILYAYFLLSV